MEVAQGNAPAESSKMATNTHKIPSKPHPKQPPSPAQGSMSEVMRRRLNVIQEGDNVLLRLPSDAIKAVVASEDGLVQLGKFGQFPAKLLLGLHYDITYEIYPNPDHNDTTQPRKAREETAQETSVRLIANADKPFGQARGKKKAKQKSFKDKVLNNEKNVEAVEGLKSNPGWKNLLRPLKMQPLIDAVLDDVQETNEFIDDTEMVSQAVLSHEEIAGLKAQGISAEEMIKLQMERHERFDMKTNFSKEKWRKKKEKKYLQTIHPISPSAANIADHYFSRSPASTLSLRSDTLSQLLTLCNARPGGRYLVVDDTGGLVTAGIMERMGCEGRILTFVDADSPPGWGVLNTMNFSEQEMGCIKHLNWMEAEEEYERPGLPEESDMPSVAEIKTIARQKRHFYQTRELNNTRDELHTGNWDGLILATELNPLSVLARLTPYLAGSATITIYSQHLQILGECLQFFKQNSNYLNATLTESWTRTYQVLPGRTHPMMNTSATGGYLLQTIKVIPTLHKSDEPFVPRRKAHRAALKKKKLKEKENEGLLNGSKNEAAEAEIPATESRDAEEDELDDLAAIKEEVDSLFDEEMGNFA